MEAAVHRISINIKVGSSTITNSTLKVRETRDIPYKMLQIKTKKCMMIIIKKEANTSMMISKKWICISNSM